MNPIGFAANAGRCWAVDTDTPLTAASAAAVAAAAYGGHPIAGVGRYLSLGPPARSDLTAAEVQILLNAGLAVFAFQHVRRAGWRPTEAQGALDGAAAGRHFSAVGLAERTHAICDLEGVDVATDRAAVAAYVEAWAAALGRWSDALPGLYVGWHAGLDADSLWRLHSVHLYATDTANRPVSHRGVAYRQIALDVVLPGTGLRVDVAAIAPDLLGGELAWTVPDRLGRAPAPPPAPGPAA